MKKQIKYRKSTSEVPEYGWGGILSGASTGATLGSSLGIWGTVAGAVVGGLVGGLSEGPKEEAAKLAKAEANADILNANLYSGNAGSRNPDGLTQFPYGGMIRPSGEVQGGEVVQTGDIDTTEIEGPSHEKGGVDFYGKGYVYGKLTHFVNGKKEKFSDTATRYHNQIEKYKKINKNNDDAIKRASDSLMLSKYAHLLKNLQAEQELALQKKNSKPEDTTKEYAYGGGIGWPPNEKKDEEIKSAQLFTDLSSYGGGSYAPFATQNDISTFEPKLPRMDNMGQTIVIPKETTLRSGQVIQPGSMTNDEMKKSVADYGQELKIDENNNEEENTPVNWKNAVGTIMEAAPMIYNMFANKPDTMKTAPYMNQMMKSPERMDNYQDLREAERTYSAIINDQSLSPQQRLMAAKQLQSVKAQIVNHTNNQYKQDINRVEEQNANIRQRNIDTAMKIKDVNDANIGAYANKRAQAMGDLSQLVQKSMLEKNMRSKNDYTMNALKSAFPNLTFKPDGTIVDKTTGKVAGDDILKQVNELYTYMNAVNSGGIAYNGFGTNNNQLYYDANSQ